jgi:hypothetical protein
LARSCSVSVHSRTASGTTSWNFKARLKRGKSLITVVAIGVRVVVEVSPGGQLIVFAGDEHLAAPVRSVIEHHSKAS